MLFVSVLTLVVCACLILDILFNPSFSIGEIKVRIIYWFIPLLGALILLLSGSLLPGELWKGLTATGSINPLKILVLFISMTTLSIFLDEAGMFKYLAGIALKYAKTSQKKLFFYLFAMVSVLTVFTSNDIIILTFTPFICYFSKNAKINPIPYLFGEFVAANTWSMMLIIGNPTNIYLAASAGITFGAYTAVMALPTIMAGLCAMMLLYFIFRKDLNQPLSAPQEPAAINNKAQVWIGVAHLGICTILLVSSSYTGMEMWLITFLFACSLFLCVTLLQLVTRKRSNILLHTLVRAPWELIPFVLSMFSIVLALEKYGVTGQIALLLGEDLSILKYGIASFLTANVMNNIPMSVAFSSITGHISGDAHLPAVFASVVGSNLGAYFTPLGALAGIMWTGILKRLGVDFSFRKYIFYGAPISFAALAAALWGLSIVL